MIAIAVQWEHEDELPKMEQCMFDLIFPKSEVRDGVRMYPFVWLAQVDESGARKRAYLS